MDAYGCFSLAALKIKKSDKVRLISFFETKGKILNEKCLYPFNVHSLSDSI